MHDTSLELRTEHSNRLELVASKVRAVVHEQQFAHQDVLKLVVVVRLLHASGAGSQR